jgi:leader peptidase (prepilin peptidase) / N-methyltransferase
MLIVLLLAVLGLVFGSFVNALTWRLHEQDELRQAKDGKAQKAELRKLSILHGRSMCPACRHELAAEDLVPVASWLWLRGKCRYCHKPISWQYPAVELATAVLFAGSYLAWPLDLHGLGLFQFCCWLVVLVGFVALTVLDLKWYWLPNKIIYPLIVLAVLELLVAVAFFGGGWPAVSSGVWGVLIASGIFFVLYRISKDWIGDGDVRLGVVLGLVVGGPLRGCLLLFVASALGTLVSLPLLATGKAKRGTLIPFGPFLIAAAVIIELFGSHFVDWLNRFAG